jgi:hypothetical protein
MDGWNGEAHEEGLHVYLQPGSEPGLLCPPCQRCGAKEPTSYGYGASMGEAEGKEATSGAGGQVESE